MGYGYRPVVSKIRVLNPNIKRTKNMNYNYLHYIATREGTDLTYTDDPEKVLQYNLDLNKAGEDIFAMMSSNNTYLKYISQRPRSHGLFGNINTDDFKSVSDRLNEASKKKKVIYRGVISLSETDANALGFLNKQKWETYLKEVMPDIASALEVSPTNCTWVAAFHAEASHPHVHYMLWNNENKVENKFIPIARQKKCRQICQDAMFPKENEKIIREITKVERDEINKLRNVDKESILEYFRNIFNNNDIIEGITKEVLPGRLSPEEHQKLNKLFWEVIENLPEKGSIKLKYVSPECKEKIDNVTKFFLRQHDIKKVYQEYFESVRRTQIITGKTKSETAIALKNMEIEMYNRIGNIILKGIIRMESEILENVQHDTENENHEEFLNKDIINENEGINDYYEVDYPENELSKEDEKTLLEKTSEADQGKELDNIITGQPCSVNMELSDCYVEEKGAEYIHSCNDDKIEMLKNLDKVNFNGYTYALLKAILNCVSQKNQKQQLRESEFKVKSKEMQRIDYLHHN